MDKFKHWKFEQYFYVFMGGVFGLLVALFFLHTIFHLEHRGHIGFEGASEMEAINFFRESAEIRLGAGAILVSFSLLGFIFAWMTLFLQRFRKVKKRVATLEDIDKTRTEFIGMASHQLRTPLTSLGWTINMILDGDFGPVSDRQNKVLKEASVAKERMIILVNELLNVSQIESKRLKVTLAKVPFPKFQEMIELTVKEFKVWADKKRISLDLEFPSRVSPELWINADLFKIQQVVQNLLENAIEYTPENKNIKTKIEITNYKRQADSARD